MAHKLDVLNTFENFGQWLDDEAMNYVIEFSTPVLTRLVHLNTEPGNILQNEIKVDRQNPLNGFGRILVF